MKLVKSFVIAFLMFSKVPMPKMDLKEEDMEYMFIFFPFVGVLIGVLIILWNMFCRYFCVPEVPRVLITAVIPLIITGGIHLDGFMDCMDALSSYRDKEEMLRILKDPHIGAFSVIRLLVYVAIFLSALFIMGYVHLEIFAACFVLSRCFSGLAAINIAPAKSDGMIHDFNESAKPVNTVVRISLIAIIIAVTGWVLFISFFKIVLVIAIILAYVCTYYYYRHKCLKLLGGINGDTEGCFLCQLELIGAVILALGCLGGFR